MGHPIAYSTWLSLHRDNLKRPGLFHFVGVENYLAILRAGRGFGLVLRTPLVASRGAIRTAA